MAEASKQSDQGNPVPHEGDHDRVVMLSLKADGTPDQHNPEIIGDKEFAVAATKRQFREQAVSAVDVHERGVASGPVTIVGTPDGEPDKTEPLRVDPDPSTEALKQKHDAAAKKAESAAESAVNSLAGNLAK